MNSESPRASWFGAVDPAKLRGEPPRANSLAIGIGSILIGLILATPLTAGEKKEKDYTLLVGSVFTEEGFSLAGIEIQVRRIDGRKRKWHVTSDRRGEFAVRLPTETARYEVSTRSKNHENQTQTIRVNGEPHLDILFRLPPKTAGKGKD